MLTKCLPETLKGRDFWGDICVDGNIILQQILKVIGFEDVD
jgi:hypothetical protein